VDPGLDTCFEFRAGVSGSRLKVSSFKFCISYSRVPVLRVPGLGFPDLPTFGQIRATFGHQSGQGSEPGSTPLSKHPPARGNRTPLPPPPPPPPRPARGP